MGSKDTYKGSVKQARKQFKDTIRGAYRDYKFNKRKAYLLRQQVEVRVELETMGVWSKQIPVVIENSKPYRVKVKVA